MHEFEIEAERQQRITDALDEAGEWLSSKQMEPGSEEIARALRLVIEAIKEMRGIDPA